MVGKLTDIQVEFLLTNFFKNEEYADVTWFVSW